MQEPKIRLDLRSGKGESGNNIRLYRGKHRGDPFQTLFSCFTLSSACSLINSVVHISSPPFSPPFSLQSLPVPYCPCLRLILRVTYPPPPRLNYCHHGHRDGDTAHVSHPFRNHQIRSPRCAHQCPYCKYSIWSDLPTAADSIPPRHSSRPKRLLVLLNPNPQSQRTISSILKQRHPHPPRDHRLRIRILIPTNLYVSGIWLRRTVTHRRLRT